MLATKTKNPRVGQAFVKELQDEAAYQNVKAFDATYTFLRTISYFSQNQPFASIPAKKIKEWFGAHKINYKNCLDALVRHGLIEIDRHYIKGFKTRGYKLTGKGARLMYEGQMQYLNRLFQDKELKRRLQKQQSYHLNKASKYKEPILQYIHDGLMGYTFDPAVTRMIEESGWSYLTRLDATLSLTEFVERDFVELKHNEADHRVWNEFAGMKRELRRFFRLADLLYRFVLDIRSCHPLFLAHYLVTRSEQRSTPVNPVPVWGDALIKSVRERKERERSERLSYTNSTTTNFPSNPTTSTTTTNPISHYDGGNSDIGAELIRWNRMFSDPDTDPKAVLIRDLGYTRDQAKAALNQTINGSRQYRKFITWFKTHFPLLHRAWHRTYKDKVGIHVSAWYETRLMQDMALYQLAERLGLHLTYEFDGCGVMCRADDSEAVSKIQQLIQHIQAHSERLWGIRPVIVVKTAAGEAVDMRKPVRNRGADLTERKSPTPKKPRATPSNHTAASASRRSSNRSSRPARKRRGSPRTSAT